MIITQYLKDLSQLKFIIRAKTIIGGFCLLYDKL